MSGFNPVLSGFTLTVRNYPAGKSAGSTFKFFFENVSNTISQFRKKYLLDNSPDSSTVPKIGTIIIFQNVLPSVPGTLIFFLLEPLFWG